MEDQQDAIEALSLYEHDMVMEEIIRTAVPEGGSFTEDDYAI